jgi:hypothetical protein
MGILMNKATIEQLRLHLEEEFHPALVHVGDGLCGFLRGIETVEGKTCIVVQIFDGDVRFNWKRAQKFESCLNNIREIK